MDSLPISVEKLVTSLDTLYPKLAPSLADLHDPVKIAYQAGQRSVVDHLVSLLDADPITTSPTLEELKDVFCK